MQNVGGAGWWTRTAFAGVLVLTSACEFDDAHEAPRDGSAGASSSGPSTSSSATSSTSTSTSETTASSTSSTSSGSGGSGGSSSAAGGSGGDGASGGTGGMGGNGATGGEGGSGGSGGAGGSGGGQGGSGGSEDAGAFTTVDDAVVGTGSNQFNYVGMWKQCPNVTCMTTTTPPLYMQTNHWAGGADGGGLTDYLTFSFTGTQILFYGVKDTRYGIGMASIDGGPEATVDFYGTRAGDQLLWTSPVLASGNHQFKLRVTGMKNASSTDSTITVDRVDFR